MNAILGWGIKIADISFVHENTAHLACCRACAKNFINSGVTSGQLIEIHDSDTDDDDDDKISEVECPVCRNVPQWFFKEPLRQLVAAPLAPLVRRY